MVPFPNPALKAFSESVGTGRLLVEVWIRPLASGFELRHREDVDRPDESLESVSLGDLRRISRTTAAGSFRPNKAAPSLQRGWNCRIQSLVELGIAVDHLYPGGIPDWYAGRQANPPVTGFREFTARQTGLYRITTLLPGPLANRTIRACCSARFCLRRRLWTAPDLEPDDATEKSDLLCLEPCALLLDLARRAMKLEQEEKITLPLAAGDLAVLVTALERALDAGPAGGREGNTQDPANPRRLQLLLENLRGHLAAEESDAPGVE